MAIREGTLEEFLRDNNLGKYLLTFQKQGAWCIEDVLIGADRVILTQDIGMTRLEANKLLYLIKNSSRVPPSETLRGPNQKTETDDNYTIQPKRKALDIQYHLFTNLAPVNKRIGPFNTDQLLYCDLVNIICNAERSELGDDLTVELYTCEGYPLACRPSSYISKLSDWCLEEYPDTPLLYAVPRLKCYTDRCAQYLTAGPLCDGTDSIFIQNAECGFDTRQIRTDCHQAMYFQLIKRIGDMTGIPGHLIQLYQNDNLIHSSYDVTLDKLNIANQSALEMKPIIDFWTPGKDTNFSLNECKPTWYQEQGDYGSTFFFSCLYSLADWMAEKASGKLLSTLGHIRSITGCPPLIHALNLVFGKETLTLPLRIAIQECLVLLFKMIKPKTPKLYLPNFEVIKSERVTEYTNYFWVYLIDSSIPSHMQTEQYSTFKLTCSETHRRMTNPVLVKDVNGVDHIVEESALNKEIRLDGTLVKFLHNYKRMIKCFIRDEAIVWSTIPCPIDLTGEWESLVNKCENYPVLCVQAPLNVKSTDCPKPCMIPIANGNIGVYIDSSKDPSTPYVYFEVITGESILFDSYDLDRDVKLKQPPCFEKLALLPNVNGQGLQSITRDPEEIIMVILDTSQNMNSSCLGGKNKYELVREAFGAFCDLTIGTYDLKHIMGLTFFANNCSLQYSLTENFHESRYFLPGSLTAIYDAIQFAVLELNNFTTRYQEYKDVPRRILCLTFCGDNCSKITAAEATNLLIENNIKMDCVQLCKETLDTHNIAKASGGFSFKPDNSDQLLTIFELETMLSMKCREHRVAAFAPGEVINLRTQSVQPFDIEPSHIPPEKINMKVQTALKCLERALIQNQLASHTNTKLTKRILQELSYYQAHPHPAIEVFPGEEDIDFWRIIMEGPDDTPYQGGIFELFIEFPNEYPAVPPNIRFITPIYHCNINSGGRFFHAILDRFYTLGVRIRDIFDHVYGMLIDAEPDDSLDSVKATLLRCHRDEYIKNAKSHTQCNAMGRTKKEVRIGILGSEQNIQVNYPTHLVCPLTMELFEDPVVNQDGETYERKAIVEHLRSGKNYDPFTFRELHESELRPNKAVMKFVLEFKQEIERAEL